MNILQANSSHEPVPAAVAEAALRTEGVLQAIVLTLCLILLASRSLRGQRWQGKRLPPGPWGVPLLGVLPRLGGKPHVTLQRWWREFGDVYCVYMGMRRVLVVNGMQAMKEVYVTQGNKFIARPWSYFKKLTKGTGLVFTEGEVWREHRRFTMMCLRDLGVGRLSAEHRIQNEARYLLAEIEKQADDIDIKRPVSCAVANIISALVYGDRFDYDDPVFRANLDALDQSMRNQTVLGLVQFVPALEWLPALLPKDKLLVHNVALRDAYAQHQVEKHRATLDTSNPRDFIDAYLSRMQKLQADGADTTFEERQLLRVIQDLYITGTETVSTTLTWAFLFMLVHPDVQQCVQAEIDTVVGSGRLPSIKDRERMPYTEATINECQRRANIAVFSVPRCAQEDTIVNGYWVPKGTWVMLNRWGLHTSDRYWPQPATFDPHRFLDEQGKFINRENLVQYGAGPRVCLGQNLAKAELFIYFTSVLQTYKLTLPEGAPSPSIQPRSGITMTPEPYRICAELR